MDSERLKTFTSDGKYYGTATREEVHSKGIWHETFHCWFISKKKDRYFLHFQLRSKDKKDYPDKLDISAAGHILSTESAEEGIREVHEELGIMVTLEDLQYIGKIPDEITLDHFIDREFAHTYIYFIPEGLDMAYCFQTEEVSGMVEVELSLFELLWLESLDSLPISGVYPDVKDQLRNMNMQVDKKDFLPHSDAYITYVMTHIKKLIRE